MKYFLVSFLLLGLVACSASKTEEVSVSAPGVQISSSGVSVSSGTESVSVDVQGGVLQSDSGSMSVTGTGGDVLENQEIQSIQQDIDAIFSEIEAGGK